MSFSLWPLVCEGIQNKKSRLQSGTGTVCGRNPRTPGCSGCTPAEPYPPKRAADFRNSTLLHNEDFSYVNTPQGG
jgi:hypothetical protein